MTTQSVAGSRLQLAPSTFRRSFGVIRILVALLVLSAIVTQITLTLLHSAFKPGEYFSYFTIESSMMNVVVLFVGGWLALTTARDTDLFTSVRVSIFGYAVVTGAVYNLLLRNLPGDGGYEAPSWCNEVMHVWVPLFIIVDLIVAPGVVRLPFARLWAVISYPIAWLLFTMIRGAITLWYPYPFLEPTGPNGIVGVLLYVVGIAAFIVGIGAIAIAITRLRTR